MGVDRTVIWVTDDDLDTESQEYAAPDGLEAALTGLDQLRLTTWGPTNEVSITLDSEQAADLVEAISIWLEFA